MELLNTALYYTFFVVTIVSTILAIVQIAEGIIENLPFQKVAIKTFSIINVTVFSYMLACLFHEYSAHAVVGYVS